MKDYKTLWDNAKEQSDFQVLERLFDEVVGQLPSADEEAEAVCKAIAERRNDPGAGGVRGKKIE